MSRDTEPAGGRPTPAESGSTKAPNSTWTLRHAWQRDLGPIDVGWALGWTAITLVAVGVLISLALGRVPHPMITALTSQAILAGMAWRAVMRRGLPFRASLGITKPSGLVVVGAMSMGFGIVMLSGVLTLRLVSWLDLSAVDPGLEPGFDPGLATLLRDLGPIGAPLLLVVLGPMAEELLFRGVVLRGLAPRLGPVLATVIAATTFALLHPHPAQLVATFLLGLACGWAAWRAGWWAAVVVHASHNAMIVTTFRIDPASDGVPLAESPSWLLALVGGVAVAAGAWLLARDDA